MIEDSAGFRGGKMVVSTFTPAWWLRNSHLQTIWPAIVRKRKLKKLVRLQRERLELPDGDFIDLDWVNKDVRGPVVIILHGFEGSANSHYARGMLHRVQQEGWRGVVIHFRGCSGEHNRLLKCYHSGDTADLSYAIAALQNREPDTDFTAIGYSLGGNVLLKWLGETGDTNPLKAAIAVSVPFELKKAANRVEYGFSRFYQWYFLRCLRRRLRRKFSKIEPPMDAAFLASLTTLREFDDHFTAPIYGFRNADEYYTTTSSRQFLRYITVPTLLLHAKDDPFMTEDVIPTEEELSPAVALEVSQQGGHVGFVAGRYPWRPVYWLEERAPQFLRPFLNISI